MKTAKLVLVLLLSLLMQVLFLAPRIVIVMINMSISVLSIIKNTLTFLIKQVMNEVENITQDGKSNDKCFEKGTKA